MFKLIQIIIFFLSFISFIIIVNGVRHHNNHKTNQQQFNANSLLTTRCKAICSSSIKIKQHQHQQHQQQQQQQYRDIITISSLTTIVPDTSVKTINNCNISSCVENSYKLKKFGDCPSTVDIYTNKIESVCLDLCNDQDYKCPDIKKCCSHQCGTTCYKPDNIDINTALPSIPQNITLTERDSQNVDISFDLLSDNDRKLNRTILYVVEARAHIGKFFAVHKLGDWKWITFQHRYDMPILINHTYATKTVGQIRLRIGRWYQFRVAAVNENGTKGYSTISKEFQLKQGPTNPRKPKLLKVSKTFQSSNSSFNVNVKWSPPKSDLPIEKYKIIWSLFLKGKIKNNHSLWMEHVYVNEPQHSYEITNLLPNSSYYIQVQAISLFGKKRYISDKKSKVVNTTTTSTTSLAGAEYGNVDHQLTDNRLEEKQLKTPTPKLMVSFLANNGLVVARISWRNNNNDHSSNIKKIMDLCQGNEMCFKKKLGGGIFESVRVKKFSHDFTNLRFNTLYTVRLKLIGTTRQVSMKHFKTPSCYDLKRRIGKLEC